IMLLLTLLVAVAAGCAPYVRNWILLGDPLYPFYRGLFSSPYLSPTTMVFAETEWRSVALDLASFGPSTGSYWDFLYQFGTNPSFARASSSSRSSSASAATRTSSGRTPAKAITSGTLESPRPTSGVICNKPTGPTPVPGSGSTIIFNRVNGLRAWSIGSTTSEPS